MARLDRLDIAKRVAQLGAVLGRQFDYALLKAVWEQDEHLLQRGLSRLVAAELLYQQGRLPQASYTFKHALIQDTAYQSLLKSARQQYHERVAQVLTEQFPDITALQPEIPALHYTEAGLKEQAIPYWKLAGDLAVKRSANAEAVNHFTKGLELLESLPITPQHIQDELTLRLALGPPLIMMKGHSAREVEHSYARAYALAQELGETPQLFSALAGLWRFSFNQSALQMVRKLAEQCFALAQDMQEPALLQEAEQMLGSTLLFVGDFLSAHDHLEHGISLYHTLGIRPPILTSATDPGVVCLARTAWTLWLLGYSEQALQRMQEALTLAEALSHPYSLGFALNCAAVLHGWRREIALVQERTADLLSLARKQGFVQWLNAGMVMQGWALIEQDAIEEGMQQLHQALATAETTSLTLVLTQRLARLADAYIKCGLAEEGLRLLDEALRVVPRQGDHYYEAELLRLKGLAFLQAFSDDQQAEISFHQALDVARQQHAKAWELRAAMSLSRLWQSQGKATAARQLLAPVYHWFTEGRDTADLQEAQVLLDALR
jgi:tetratricopeptide (TPR) repeat protein